MGAIRKSPEKHDGRKRGMNLFNEILQTEAISALRISFVGSPGSIFADYPRSTVEYK